MKKMNMYFKKENGITIISLVILITLLFIITGTTVYFSTDRFEINNYKKMITDIDLLNDKIVNYYLQYNALPLLRNTNNNAIKYTYTSIDSNTDYYIIDLKAMSGITLNYGAEGYNNPNTSNDVYVIELSNNNIYYVKGIEVKDVIYHTKQNVNTTFDYAHLTAPSIKVIEGTKNTNDEYTTNVVIEFVPGINKTKNVTTTYVVNKLNEITNQIETVYSTGDIKDLTNNLLTINIQGKFQIIVTSTSGEETRDNTLILKSVYSNS